MDKRIEEITARIEKATPGEWDKYSYDGDHCVTVNTPESKETSYEHIATRILTISDRDFIANSKQDMQYLISENTRLTAELQTAWKQLHEEIEKERALAVKLEHEKARSERWKGIALVYDKSIREYGEPSCP